MCEVLHLTTFLSLWSAKQQKIETFECLKKWKLTVKVAD